MIKIVVLSLLLCIYIVNVQSTPVQKSGRSHSQFLNRQKRTFGLDLFTPRDWSQFQATWRLPQLPLSPINIWEDNEDLNRRVAELEIGQRRIIDYLRKLQAEKSAIPCKTMNNQFSDKQDQPNRELTPPTTPTTTTTTTAAAASASTTFATTKLTTASSSDIVAKEGETNARKEATASSTTANKENITTTAASATKEATVNTTMRKDNVTSEKSVELDASSTTIATSVLTERVTTPTVVQAANTNDVL